jgi:hypothetical protein
MELSDESIRSRGPCGGRWYNVDEGDYITNVSGYSTSNRSYICYSLRIEFANGTRPIDVVAEQPSWKGDKFTLILRTTELITGLRQLTRGHPGLQTVRTSIHLPLDRTVVELLPRECQKQYHLIRSEFNEHLAEDLQMKILGYLTGYDLVPRG